MLLPVEMVARMKNCSMCLPFFPKGEALCQDTFIAAHGGS